MSLWSRITWLIILMKFVVTDSSMVWDLNNNNESPVSGKTRPNWVELCKIIEKITFSLYSTNLADVKQIFTTSFENWLTRAVALRIFKPFFSELDKESVCLRGLLFSSSRALKLKPVPFSDVISWTSVPTLFDRHIYPQHKSRENFILSQNIAKESFPFEGYFKLNWSTINQRLPLFYVQEWLPRNTPLLGIEVKVEMVFLIGSHLKGHFRGN